MVVESIATLVTHNMRHSNTTTELFNTIALGTFHQSGTDLRVRSLDDNKGHIWQASHAVDSIKDNVSQAMVGLVSENMQPSRRSQDFEEKETDLMRTEADRSTEMWV
ncbi:hypothetical protein EDB85DRAFT_1887439 [Lactarius pseudohatsudake]|nr:hypothetical protein EDB85DRAFT_1887439 [Lactarius pseudohatsudake]